MESRAGLDPAMDHRLIDQKSFVERYLAHALTPQERAEFEAHLVDCQECTDRLLLAEMFHAREPNGDRRPDGSPGGETPLTSRLVLRLKRRQLVLLAATAIFLLALPAFVIFVLLR